MFEPFFTTKPVGKGTGLGLSIVHAIVGRCGGGIQVSSNVGQGTSFKIYFPQMQNIVVASGHAADPQRSLQGTETILLVDDDDLVRRATRSILVGYGYRVFEAESGKMALRVFLDQAQSIQLLITDQMMPEMSGSQLVGDIIRLKPGLPALLISGYLSEPKTVEHSSERNIGFLQKPFQPQVLAIKVREVLELPRNA